MAVEENNITNAKLEINGDWYETRTELEGNGCDKCDLKQMCITNVTLYKLCTHLPWHIGFKKTGQNTEEARFFHG